MAVSIPPTRHRGVFSLPSFSENLVHERKTACRSVLRHRLAKQHALRWANDGILALNQLGGGGVSCDPTVPRSEVCSLVTERVADAYLKAGKPPPDVASPEEASPQVDGLRSEPRRRRPLRQRSNLMAAGGCQTCASSPTLAGRRC